MARNEAAAARDPMEGVSVMIPHTYDENAKGVRVNVNTKDYFVPYNETVTVPRYIAEVVQRSMAADRAAAKRRKEASKSKCLGEI